jgi:hypothetical protein
MLRALAAELADPGRFGRAKAYARDDAVTDIQVEPGSVRAVVQGSRRDPYVVTVHVRPLEPDEAEAAAGGTAPVAQLLPGREDLAVACTCPDGDQPGVVCKHALATLLVLADEVSIEPALLVRWRSGDRTAWEPGPLARAGRASGRPGSARPPVATGRVTVVDVLAERLRSPVDRPPLPTLAPAPRVPVTDGFSEVLAEALDELRRLSSPAAASG